MAQNARTVITNAQRALGNVDSITYSGSARNVAFQQCGASGVQMLCFGTHDPMRPIMEYVRVIDLDPRASREAGATVNMGGGGSTAIVPGTFFQQVTAEQANLAQPWAGSLEFYITPWGFLAGAAERGAVASRERMAGEDYTVLSWSPDARAPSGARYVVKGYINDANLVVKVETWLGENIMGDMHIVANYADWRDFGGFMAPTRIEQTRGGWPFFDVDITAARANPADLASIAPAPAPAGPGRGGRGGGPGGAGGPPAISVTAERLGDGLYRLTTGAGSYDSVIIEFDDHVMMLEAGQNEAGSLAYIAETKRLMPGKPIRYVMNTHAHADHTRGIPTLVAEGATIITHANNQEFFERALNTPRTLLDDVLARNPRPAAVDPVYEMKAYSDGDRTVEMYHIWPTPHSNGLLVAYIPEEGVLFQGDFSLPQPGQPGNDHVQALVPALEKLGVVDFDRYINVHASAEPQTKAELWAAAGR
ncbi:MAG: MBL fold metallo-hydrolase, partial [Betaproteobacteria bacterium]|nr:MBL fold metallo-hydrolase [Betaproteobacteria bacterium]